jgi:hypothetical protein
LSFAGWQPYRPDRPAAACTRAFLPCAPAGFFLRRKLTTPRGLLQNGELIFSLPEILTLFAYDVVHAGMLLKRFKLGLKGEKFGLRLFLGFIPAGVE